MILTKLLEISGSFNNLKIYVSTRQPHLLRPFQQEFGIEAEFNNAKVVMECDIIFLCVLPSQAQEMFKEIKAAEALRLAKVAKNKGLSKPLFVSCIAATGFNKLKLMLSEDASFLKTQIHVPTVRDYLVRTNNALPENAAAESVPVE